jgi:GT2 family glycosyltransferase
VSPLDASVVICSRNRPDFVLEAVRSVLQGTAVPAELIVVDQSDAEHETLRRLPGGRGCELRYLWTQQRGVSRARNTGLRAARQAIVAYTDDDVAVGAGWLQALVQAVAADNGERTVATGRVLAAPSEFAGAFASAIVASDEPALYHGRVARDVLLAGNMAAFRTTLEGVGGFDERLGPGTAFPAGEDNDMGFRLLAAGCQVRYVPDAVIYHRAWRGQGQLIPLRWRYGVGQGAYYAKHLSPRDGYMLGRLGRLLAHHLWLALRRAPREPHHGLGHLAYVAGVLVGGARWLVFSRKTGE